jgi:hypothetical protein
MIMFTGLPMGGCDHGRTDVPVSVRLCLRVYDQNSQGPALNAGPRRCRAGGTAKTAKALTAAYMGGTGMDQWGRLENDNRRRIEQQRADQADYIRRYGGMEVPNVPKLPDPPPTKATVVAGAITLVGLILMIFVLCGASVYVFFARMPHP